MTGWSWENSLSDSWLLATETGMCRVCQEARLALDRPGETTAGEVAIQLLSAGAVDTLVAAVVEALATDRRLEVAVLAPSGPGAWRVIAAANSDRHGDKVIAERFPELSAASRTGLPARRGLRSMSPDPRTPPTSTGDEAVALALPVWFVPGHAEPVMLWASGGRSGDSATHALIVLLAHLLRHRLCSLPPETAAHQLGCGFRQGSTGSLPKVPPSDHARREPLDDRGAAPEREQTLRHALERKIDELAEANRALEQCARLGTRLITDAAHELRSPVAILHSYLETLTTDLIDGLPLEHREFLRGALAGADRLQGAVDELLDVAALESGDLCLDLGPVPLDEVLAGLGRVLVPAAARGGVEVHIKAEDALIVRADRTHLERILRAVIGTVARFTTRGGAVDITTRSTAAEVETAVEGLDVALDSADIEHVFDPFFRARRGPANTGFSLGLVTARRLTHLLGSRLDVQPMPSGGVRIVLAIPLWTAQS